MKNLNIILAVIAFSFIFTSCGGSKDTVKGQQWGTQRIKQEVDECVKLANAGAGYRAWGMGSSFDISTAVSYAEANARAQFRRAIMTSIKNSQDIFNQVYKNSASNSTAGQQVMDESAKNQSWIQALAEGIVTNMATIKTSQYLRVDGAYDMYVCLEYKEGIGKLAEKIAKQVEQQVSDDQRLKIDYDFEKYRQRVEDELENMKMEN